MKGLEKLDGEQKKTRFRFDVGRLTVVGTKIDLDESSAQNRNTCENAKQ